MTNKKAATTVQKIFMGVLFFGALLTGFGVFISGATSEYGVDTDLPVWNKTDEINSTMTNLYNAMTDGNLFSTVLAFFALPVTIVIQLFNGLAYTNDMISVAISQTTGMFIPPWFLGLIQTGVIVVIIFAIMNAMTGRRQA